MYNNLLFLRTARRRLSSVKRVVVFGSGKGGVGKSVVSAATALALSEKGYRVGLLDLDVHGPSSARILKPEGRPSGSKHGIRPVNAGGVELMTVEFFLGDLPLPLSGGAKTSLVAELLMNVDWGEKDFLVVDLPPGLGDETIVPLRALKSLAHTFLVVTSPSALSYSVVRRLLSFLVEERVNVGGLVVNYVSPVGEEGYVKRLEEEFGIITLARIPFDEKMEAAISERNVKLAETFFNAVRLLSEVLAR